MSPTLVNYLTQISTWSGLLKLACALGLLHVTPQVQDQMATDLVQLMTGLLGLVGIIDVLRNERKQPADSQLHDTANGSTVPTNSTQQKG